MPTILDVLDLVFSRRQIVHLGVNGNPGGSFLTCDATGPVKNSEMVMSAFICRLRSNGVTPHPSSLAVVAIGYFLLGDFANLCRDFVILCYLFNICICTRIYVSGCVPAQFSWAAQVFNLNQVALADNAVTSICMVSSCIHTYIHTYIRTCFHRCKNVFLRFYYFL